MGWNTWNTFAQNINEQLILESAQAMVDNGLKDAGYNYIVIDDIWALKERDENGRLVKTIRAVSVGEKLTVSLADGKAVTEVREVIE